MRGYWLTGPRRVELLEKPTPTPGKEEILVRVHCSCLNTGSMLHAFRTGYHAPYYMGEGSAVTGTVVEGGGRFRAGDRVVCPGNHGEYAVAPLSVAVPLPEGVDPAAASLAMHISLGLHAVRQGRLTVGENCAVFGQGVVGLACALTARLAGARVAVVDLAEERLRAARRLGLGLAVSPRDGSWAEQVLAYFGEAGTDLVVEASGHWGALRDGLKLARRGTRFTFPGIFRDPPPADLALELHGALWRPGGSPLNYHGYEFIGCQNDPAVEAAPDLVRFTRGRNLAFILDKMAQGDLPQDVVQAFPAERFPALLSRLDAGDPTLQAVVLKW